MATVSDAEKVALQQAGQYANSPTPWTPENAPDVGLDPERGFVAKGTPAAPSQPPPPAAQPSPLPEPTPPKIPGAVLVDESNQKPAPQIPGAVLAEPDKKATAPQIPGAAVVPDAQQAQPVAAPTPTPQGPTTTEQPPPALTIPTPTPEAAPPDPHELQQVLKAQGLTPGQAQQVAAGQTPKTISGETPPPPKPKTPAVTPQEPAPQTTTYIPPPLINGKAPTGSTQSPQVADQPTPDLSTPYTGKVTHVDVDGSGPATLRYNNPGGMWDGNSARRFGSSTYGIIGGGNHIAKFDTPEQGAAAQFDLLNRAYQGKTVANALAKWTGETGGPAQVAAYVASVCKATGLSPSDVITSDFLKSPKGIAFAKAQAEQEAGKSFPITDDQWRKAQGMAFSGVPFNPKDSSGQLVGPGGTQSPSHGGNGGGSKSSGDPFAGQPLFSIPTTAGGGGSSGSAPPQSPSFGGGGGSGGESAPRPSSDPGSLSLGALGGGGGDSQQAQPQPSRQSMQVSAPLPDQGQDPMVAALVSRGYTPQQAIQFAQSSQTVTPGKGIGPLNVQGPPPAAPSAKSLQFKPVSTKALMPGKVTPIVPAKKPGALPPPAPSAPSAQAPASQATAPATPKVDPSVVLGLMKRGFSREQALAFANKATVAPQQQTRPASPAPAAPPAKAPQPQQAQAPQKPAQPPLPKPSAEPTEFTGRPAGSTHGDPNPPGIEALSGKLSEQAKQHKALLSLDDARVSKQADGLIKGEHFVEGDPFHDQLLSGLPHGKQGHQRQLLGQAETAIADKAPMHISYISAPAEAQKFPTRDSRKVQYDESSPEARLMGTTTGQLVGHSFIPLSAGIKLPAKKDEPHQSYVQGISTNVLANNFQHLNDKMAGMGRKSPYKELGAKFSNDLEGYFHNLNAGHTATGTGYAVGTEDHPNEPDREHVPYKLSRKEADFIGAVINNDSAFAQHNDAKKIRELARANGTLITEKGETNRLRHDIETHEPGWRKRMLEPSIRTFKTGLIHEVHPNEEHFPQEIRPGKGYQQLTKALARTSERGRPDIPIGASLHHTFDDNKKINAIERDFSDHKIDEAEARNRIKALGEDPEDYRFVGGSGGLITPYEDDPEALTPEEHNTMKDNLRQSWVGGKMNVEDYRKKSAEVPLPSRPSKPAAPKPVAEAPKPPKITTEGPTGNTGPIGTTGTTKPPKPIVPEPEEPEAPETPEKPPEPSIPPPAPVTKPKQPKAPKPQSEPSEEPAVPPKTAPAPDEPLPKPAEKPEEKSAEAPAHTFKEVKPEEFIEHRNKSSKPEFLSDLKPEDIQKHKLFTNQDNTIGAAVSPEGDIQNVFNNGGEKGGGAHAVAHAIEHHGGRTLDAYDGFLPKYYRQFGFHETGRTKFNPEYAPKWDTAKHGTPDVVHMGWGGHPEGGPDAAVARAKNRDQTKWIDNERSTHYDDDFDAQKARSQTYARGAKADRPDGAPGKAKVVPAGKAALPGSGVSSGRTVAPAYGEPLPPVKKGKKAKKSPEQIAAEKEDLRQADIHRKTVTPERQAARDQIQQAAQQALAANPESDPLSAHHYIHGHATLPDWIKTKEHIGKHFDQANPKLDYAKDEHRQRAADALTHDVLHGLSKNSSAYDWYDDTVDKSLNHIGQVAPKILSHKDHEMAFKLATAITSQGQDVFPNFESGYLGYRHWHKTGKMPEDPAIFGGGPKAQAMVANFKKVNRLMKELGPDGLREVLEKKMTMRQLRDDYGISLAGESPDHEMEGAAMLGPKIGSFYNNLNKRFHSTTFDLWATRNLNRIAGSMLKFSPNSLLKDSETKKGPKPGQLSKLDALLANGKITGADAQQQKMMRAEVAALRKLKNPTRERVLAAAPTIAEWSGREHGRYAKGTGDRSYPKEMKSDSTSLAKNMDLNLTDLSDAPRGPKQRKQFRDIYERTQANLAKHGIDMAHASNQAVLWFIEQKLFQMGGSRNRASFDYLDASHRLVRKIKSGELPALHGEGTMSQAA